MLKSCQRSKKLQSAMEYLSTYGWAILIIAVALVSLFYLGVFSPYTYAPKMLPGSCYVVRSNYTAPQLSGDCNGIPEFVTEFNGQNSYVSINGIAAANGQSQFTVSLWIYAKSYPSASSALIYSEGSPQVTLQFGINPSGDLFTQEWYSGSPILFTSSTAVPLNQWVFVSAKLANGAQGSGTIYIYTDSNPPQSGSGQEEYSSSATYYTGIGGNIGYLGGQSLDPFNGMISNVQVYTTALSTNSINALYQEGIGGAPIDMQDLAGWWPLNGNANDYSGAGNNGAVSGISYYNGWFNSGYTAP